VSGSFRKIIFCCTKHFPFSTLSFLTIAILRIQVKVIHISAAEWETFSYNSRYYYGLKIEVRGRKWKLTAILVLSYMTAYCLGSHGNFIILLVVCSPTKNRRKNQQLLQLYCSVTHKLNQST